MHPNGNGNGHAPRPPHINLKLALRADAIKLIRSLEADLAAEGYPVQSAVRTRQERRTMQYERAGEG